MYIIQNSCEKANNSKIIAHTLVNLHAQRQLP